MVVILCIVVLGIAFLVMPVAANNVVCHEDSLSNACRCNACAATALNLQVTRTCDGLQLTWNDIGYEYYVVAYYDPDINYWIDWKYLSGTSYFISNADLQSGT